MTWHMIPCRRLKKTHVPVIDSRDESDVGGAAVEEKHRAITDDAKVRETPMFCHHTALSSLIK